MTENSAVPSPAPAPKIDTTVPVSARIWNYWMGGKDNYPVDQEAGDQWEATSRHARHGPGIPDFLDPRIVYLAGEGIRQFLDRHRPAEPRTNPSRSPSGSRRGSASSTSTTTLVLPRPGPADQQPEGTPTTSTPT